MEALQLPEAFEARMKALLGAEYEEFIYCYSNDRYQALRFNPLKKGLDEAAQKRIWNTLQKGASMPPESVPWEPLGVYYDGEMRPGKHAYHEMGLYYIQEPSAMSAAAVLSPKPGMRVLDLCAAPGGKSTQLAAYLAQKGLLVANEINSARAKILASNVERMGIGNAIVTNEDSGRLAEHFVSFFHAILVDSPCSGEGMFRKNPEAIEEWSTDNVALCAGRSAEILDNAARMLLPGGDLVYSTCTFAPEENEQIIAGFLQTHEEFELKKVDCPWFEPGNPRWLMPEQKDVDIEGATFRLWPHKLHGEGHFVACLHKKGELPVYDAAEHAREDAKRDVKKDIKKDTKGRKAAQTSVDSQKALEEFFEEALSKELAQELRSRERLLFGDQLYVLPDGAPRLTGLRVLRAGLHIGEFKKNRLEPSHALALYMGEKDASCVVELTSDDNRCNAYFRGESLQVTDAQIKGKNKGWCLVCIDGFSAGWGKLSQGQVKNHYPKGLRRDLCNFAEN